MIEAIRGFISAMAAHGACVRSITLDKESWARLAYGYTVVNAREGMVDHYGANGLGVVNPETGMVEVRVLVADVNGRRVAILKEE